MKIRILNICLCSIVLIQLGCSSQKEYIVESDYSFSARFKKYKTFKFMKMQESDTTDLKGILEKTIGSRMSSQGYDLDEKKPDLLIGYKVYMNNFNMTGYSQPQLEEWVLGDWPDRLLTDDDVYRTPPPLDHPDTEYHNNKLEMKNGTLLITFYDRRREKTVWSGYASGIFAKNDDNITRSFRSATGKIFHEFRLISDGYLIN